MAKEVKAKQTNGSAEEVKAVNGGIEETDTSPVSTCSASEEEGVSRTTELEVNSDTYSADVSLVSSDGSDSSGRAEGEFVDLPWTRKRTFLEKVQNKEINPDELMDLISSNKEKVNRVEQKKDGYGAIHYIAEGKYKFKTELLVVLVIYGHANLDLTTTHKDQVTALHLAAQIEDVDCVKTLISLGADFNKKDAMGRTPLDFAIMTANRYREDFVQMEEYEIGQKMVIGEKMVTDRGLTRTVELTESSIHFESQSSFTVSKEPLDSTIIDVLKSVGATTGSANSREDDLLSSLIGGDKKTATSDELSHDSGRAVASFATDAACTETDHSSKDHCKSYTVLDSEISKRLKNLSHSPTPEEALELVKDMRDRERLRQKYGSRILCLDGGGIRGLITLCILQEIERRMDMDITKIFDWIVGTSTGGIIALGLCYGPKDRGPKTVRELRDLYWAIKTKVFSSTPLLLKKSDDKSKELELTLKEWLGEDVLMESASQCGTASNTKHLPKLLISAVSKKTDVELHFFNNCFSNEYSGELVWKVARYTSANFMYFTEFEDYIDGGVVANNPSEEGLTAIQDHYHEKGEKLPISLLVSIGSGINPSKEIGSVHVQRLQAINPLRWKNLIDLFGSVIDVINRRAHSNCEARCREQGIGYFRLNPELDDSVDSDQIRTKKLLSMLWETKVYLHKQKDTMDTLVKLLKQSSFCTR